MNWKSKYDKDELLKEGLITKEEYETWDTIKIIKIEDPKVLAFAKAERKRIRNATKRQIRRDIADMCGTSYAAACRDMGLSRQ